MIVAIAEPQEWSDLAPLVESAQLQDVSWVGGMNDAFDTLLGGAFDAVLVAYSSLAAGGLRELEAAAKLLDASATRVIVILGSDQVAEEEPLRALTGWTRFWGPPWAVENLWALLQEDSPDATARGASGEHNEWEAERRTPVPSYRSARESAVQEAEAEERELTRQKLQDELLRMERSDAYGVFGLSPGCRLDQVESRYVALAWEYHPDNFSHFRDRDLQGLAEKILIRVRDSRKALQGQEGGGRNDSGAMRTASGAYRSAASAGASRPTSRRPVSSAGSASRATASSSSNPTARMGSAPTSASSSVSSSAPQRTPEERKAALERLQRLARESTLPKAPPRVEAIGAATSKMASVQGGFLVNAKGERKVVSAEQLVRNAKNAIESGAYEKAWKMLSASAVASGRIDARAYLPYAAFLAQKCTVEEAERDLLSMLQEHLAEREISAVKCVLGHIYRITKDHKRAKAAFQESVRADPANAEAISWTRHYQNRPAKRGAMPLTDGKPEGTLLKRLFKGRG